LFALEYADMNISMHIFMNIDIDSFTIIVDFLFIAIAAAYGLNVLDFVLPGN
jgi:hypothetical protein